MSEVRVEWVDRCASTQDEVVDRLAAAQPGAVLAVATGAQERGRGREGRRWEQSAGEALALSIGVRGPSAALELGELPRRVGDAVRAELGTELAWKAPNDLVDPRTGAKVAGILVDVLTVGDDVEHAVVGIGINLRGTPFTTSDGRAATSVEAARGAPVGETPAQIAASLARRIAGELTRRA